MEWTVLLFSKISKERRKIGGQAGGGKKGLGGKQLNIVDGKEQVASSFNPTHKTHLFP